MKTRYKILALLTAAYGGIGYLAFSTDDRTVAATSFALSGVISLGIGGVLGYCAAFISKLPH